MANKTKIRSIRFSEEMIDIIERQVGDNFNKKFETLVYNCYMVLPQRQEQIKELDQRIAEKKKQLTDLAGKYQQLSGDLGMLSIQVDKFATAVRALKDL